MRNPLYQDEWLEKLPPVCTVCGYNLTGSSGTRCPECGARIDWQKVREFSRATYHSLRLVEDANLLVDFSIQPLMGGIAIAIVLVALGQAILAQVVGGFAGFAVLIMSLQAFRAKTIPEWALARISERPKYGKAMVLAALAVAVIVGSIAIPSVL